jgi:hypothetical protein
MMLTASNQIVFTEFISYTALVVTKELCRSYLLQYLLKSLTLELHEIVCKFHRSGMTQDLGIARQVDIIFCLIL